MSETVVIVQYTALAEKAPTALAAIRALVRAVVSGEPACGGIEILQELDAPERITLIERWPSREVFLGPHMQQPHIQDFIRGAGEFLAGPPQISFHAVVESATGPHGSRT